MLYGDIRLPAEALGTDLPIGPNRLIAKQRAVSCLALGPQALLETGTPEHLASCTATLLALGGPPGCGLPSGDALKARARPQSCPDILGSGVFAVRRDVRAVIVSHCPASGGC